MIAANAVHVPFEVGGGGGAGFDIDIAVTAEGGDHEDIGTDDRPVRENLVDAPGAGDDGSFPGIDDPRPHGAGDHIEETADHGCAFGKPRHSRSFARHLADDVSRFHATGEERERVLKIVERQKLAVEPRFRQGKQPSAAEIGNIIGKAPRQAEIDKILTEQDRTGPGIEIGCMSLHPSEKAGCLRRPWPLQATGLQLCSAFPVKLGRHIGSTAVERLDADQGLPVLVQKIEAIAVAGAAHCQYAAGIDGRFHQKLADCLAAVPPQFLEIALDIAGLRKCRLSVDGMLRNLPAFRVEQHGLDDRVADIETQYVIFVSHDYRYPMLPHRPHPDG